MKLHDLYDRSGCGHKWMIPYRLLQEREPHQNISHKAMPTWDQHCAFVRSKPYPHWYWFTSPAVFSAGCIYLTERREIGVGVLSAHRGQGLAKEAIAELMRLHPGPFLANINPYNEASVRLFTGLGFNLLQHTYALEAI